MQAAVGGVPVNRHRYDIFLRLRNFAREKVFVQDVLRARGTLPPELANEPRRIFGESIIRGWLSFPGTIDDYLIKVLRQNDDIKSQMARKLLDQWKASGMPLRLFLIAKGLYDGPLNDPGPRPSEALVAKYAGNGTSFQQFATQILYEYDANMDLRNGMDKVIRKEIGVVFTEMEQLRAYMRDKLAIMNASNDDAQLNQFFEDTLKEYKQLRGGRQYYAAAAESYWRDLVTRNAANVANASEAAKLVAEMRLGQFQKLKPEDRVRYISEVTNGALQPDEVAALQALMFVVGTKRDDPTEISAVARSMRDLLVEPSDRKYAHLIGNLFQAYFTSDYTKLAGVAVGGLAQASRLARLPWTAFREGGNLVDYVVATMLRRPSSQEVRDKITILSTQRNLASWEENAEWDARRPATQALRRLQSKLLRGGPAVQMAVGMLISTCTPLIVQSMTMATAALFSSHWMLQYTLQPATDLMVNIAGMGFQAYGIQLFLHPVMDKMNQWVRVRGGSRLPAFTVALISGILIATSYQVSGLATERVQQLIGLLVSSSAATVSNAQALIASVREWIAAAPLGMPDVDAQIALPDNTISTVADLLRTHNQCLLADDAFVDVSSGPFTSWYAAAEAAVRAQTPAMTALVDGVRAQMDNCVAYVADSAAGARAAAVNAVKEQAKQIVRDALF
jgi:hypothetical protein